MLYFPELFSLQHIVEELVSRTLQIHWIGIKFLPMNSVFLFCQLERKGKGLECETIFSFSFTKAVNSTQTPLLIV